VTECPHENVRLRKKFITNKWTRHCKAVKRQTK